MENNMNNQNGNNRPQNNNKVSNKNTGIDLKSMGLGVVFGIAGMIGINIAKNSIAKKKAKKAAAAQTAPAPEPETAK